VIAAFEEPTILDKRNFLIYSYLRKKSKEEIEMAKVAYSIS
jgi:hypothetical protein